MKRLSIVGEEIIKSPAEESATTADALMLLSRGFADSSAGRMFECKTCNRRFASFQALGGHRASHKKPRALLAGCHDGRSSSEEGSPEKKQRVHECSVCGLEFSIGQALGGHMRRHRPSAAAPPPHVEKIKPMHGRRVFCFDLNLMPYENERESRKIGCFY